MGVVYLARDQRLGRVVAIKTIAAARVAAPDQISRFMFEARAVARMQHPNIIAIHAIGEDPAQPYLSLEYIDGGSLAQRLADRPIGPLEAAHLLELLARAVQAMHEQGIVHRDLKPSNVLLTALGVPKIADFGLAKLKDTETEHTLSEQVLGTPSFMAPEQAEGHSKHVGPPADIYALGAILYQALTGRPPFMGGSALETLKLVTTTEPVPPTRHRPGVPRDLETICLRCLEKEPARRYSSAAALADDLRRFQEGRPITARRIGPAGHVWRWAGRNQVLAVTATTLILTFVLGTPTLLLLWLRARADRSVAMVERNRARNERDRAERSRNRAIGAVQVLLRTESEGLLSEELRPYRKRIIDAGLTESLALARELDGDPTAEVEVVWAHSSVGQLQFEAGDREKGLVSLRKAIGLAERLVAREPGSVKSRETLAMVLQRASTLLPDIEERRSILKRSIGILKGLLAERAEGNRHEWNRLVAMNYYNDGHYHFINGRAAEAISAFREARAAYDEVLAQPDALPLERSMAAQNLLYLSRASGNRFDASMEAAQKALGILERLIAANADSFDYAQQLYLVQAEIGVKGVAAQKWDLAIRSLESARSNLKDQAGRWGKMVSRMATIQDLLGMTDFNLRIAYQSDPVRYAEQLRALAREMFEICEKLSLIQPLSYNLRIVHAQSCLTEAEYRDTEGLGLDLDLLRKSARLWTELYGPEPSDVSNRGVLVILQRKIADALEASGQAAEAASRRRESLVLAKGHPDLLYELAVGYASDAGIIARIPTKLDVKQVECRREMLIAEACAMLRAAIAEGFHDAIRARKEPAFEPLRALPEFRAVLLDLELPADPFAKSVRRP
jgi:tetratricopeptide (TPR) repeat protein